MTMKSSAARYGGIAMGFHWITAVMIFALVPLGFLMGEAEAANQVLLYRLHAGLGLAAFALTTLRVVWWWVFDRRPEPLAGAAWQVGLAKAVHVGFYVALLVLGASGIGTMALSGAGVFIFEQGVAPPAGIFDGVPPAFIHGLMARLLLALLVLHVAGALMHHLRKRDGVFARILPGG
jgi:cytochrome b561